jgi:hypothetical protein
VAQRSKVFAKNSGPGKRDPTYMPAQEGARETFELLLAWTWKGVETRVSLKGGRECWGLGKKGGADVGCS